MRNIINGVGAYIKRTDRWLWAFALTATAFGTLTLISMKLSMGWSWSTVGMATQIGAMFIGILGAIVLSNIDYTDIIRLWKIYTPIVYGLLIFMYIFRYDTRLVMEQQGNYNWLLIPLGGSRRLSIQPSEFLKLVFILDYSLHISRVKEQINKPFYLIPLLLHAAIPAGLIHLLGDDGTAIIFLLIALIMLVANGLSWMYIVGGSLVLVIALVVAWNVDIIKDYQKERIIAIYRPDLLDEQTLKDVLYQQNQGRMSMGIGGTIGGGFVLENPYNVVYMLNDFIFTYVGQYAGFLGCLLVIGILTALSFKCLIDARRSNTTLGKSICAGVFAFFGVQTAMNLGMCVGALPVIGVPLPFFSQGGTSMLVNWLAVGLVLSVYSHNNTPLFKYNY